MAACFVVMVLEIAEQLKLLEIEIAELLLLLVGGDMVVVVEVIGDVKTETEVVVGDGIAESSAGDVVDIVVVVVILVAFAMVVAVWK